MTNNTADANEVPEPDKTSSLRNCQQCGASMESSHQGNVCSACLFRVGFESDDNGKRTGSGTGAGGASFNADDSLETVQKLFPGLEILECIGKGGMGIVYKARQTHLGRLVALKLLRAKCSGDPSLAERFTREARALAKLSHPNIVGVHDFGQSGDRPYLIMEYVDGVNLRVMLESKTLNPVEAMAMVPAICEALHFAHDEGVVHRDIKPENILVDRRGRVRIADFGLARLMTRSKEEWTLTGTRQVMGTPHYMAPEQIEHPQDVDHRADIYSLGVVIYEMLTGELPIGRFELPSNKVNVDVRFDEIVLRTLEKEPMRRYQYVTEVQTAVENIATDTNQLRSNSKTRSNSQSLSDGLAVVLSKTLFHLKRCSTWLVRAWPVIWRKSVRGILLAGLWVAFCTIVSLSIYWFYGRSRFPTILRIADLSAGSTAISTTDEIRLRIDSFTTREHSGYSIEPQDLKRSHVQFSLYRENDLPDFRNKTSVADGLTKIYLSEAFNAHFSSTNSIEYEVLSPYNVVGMIVEPRDFKSHPVKGTMGKTPIPYGQLEAPPTIDRYGTLSPNEINRFQFRPSLTNTQPIEEWLATSGMTEEQASRTASGLHKLLVELAQTGGIVHSATGENRLRPIADMLDKEIFAPQSGTRISVALATQFSAVDAWVRNTIAIAILGIVATVAYQFSRMVGKYRKQ